MCDKGQFIIINTDSLQWMNNSIAVIIFEFQDELLWLSQRSISFILQNYILCIFTTFVSFHTSSQANLNLKLTV